MPSILGHATLKNEDIDQTEVVGSTTKFIEQKNKVPTEDRGPKRAALRVSKLRGFYELFCRTFLSNQDVMSPANQGFGHISVYLLGQCQHADGLFLLTSGDLCLNRPLPMILTNVL